MPDIGQQYLTFDQARDELEGSDVKGRNPFKDRRVRQAVWHALNIELIVDKVLRGQAEPVGAFLSPLVDGADPALDAPPALRPCACEDAAGRGRLSGRLLGHAGLRQHDLAPVGLPGRHGDAVAGRHPHHAARHGAGAVLPQAHPGHGELHRVRLDRQPDAWGSLNGLFRSWDRSGLGSFNAGRYSNPALDR
jgi:peptide/nickel transport system substrate-binding protein